jgi:hypothetical protein
MNKRRRFKAKRRRRLERLKAAIRRDLRVFLKEATRASTRSGVYAACRRMERMFPRSGVFGNSLIGGPRV